jgi:hypothetical protein
MKRAIEEVIIPKDKTIHTGFHEDCLFSMLDVIFSRLSLYIDSVLSLAYAVIWLSER